MTPSLHGDFQRVKSESLFGQVAFIVPSLVEILRHRRHDELAKMRDLVKTMLAQPGWDDNSARSRANVEALLKELDELFHEISLLMQTKS